MGVKIKYDGDGLVKLCYALLENAIREYEFSISCCNYSRARITALKDSKGIIGNILEFIGLDKEYFLNKINEAERSGSICLK